MLRLFILPSLAYTVQATLEILLDVSLFLLLSLAGVQSEFIQAARFVDLVVADGGLPTDGGDQAWQEEAFTQLLICQSLLAVSVLSAG